MATWEKLIPFRPQTFKTHIKKWGRIQQLGYQDGLVLGEHLWREDERCGFISLVERRLRANLKSAYNYFKGSCEDDGARFFLVGQIMQQGQWPHMYLRHYEKHFYWQGDAVLEQVYQTSYRISISGGIWGLARPSLGLPNQVLDVVLLGAGCCTRWSSGFLPTNVILCFSALKAASVSDLKEELRAAKLCLFLIQSGEQIKHTTSTVFPLLIRLSLCLLSLVSCHTETLFQ